MPVDLQALDKIPDDSIDNAIAAVDIFAEANVIDNTALGIDASAFAIVREALVARKASLVAKTP